MTICYLLFTVCDIHCIHSDTERLRTLILENESLSRLLDCFSAVPADSTLFQKATDAFFHLVSKLDISASFSGTTESTESDTCMYHVTKSTFDMEFLLEKNTRLKAHRAKMAAVSEVFAAMLLGKFTESSLTEIPLLDVDADAFDYMLHYVYGCNACQLILQASTEICIEVLKLSDRFLLNELRNKIASVLYIKSRKESITPLIFDCAIIYNCHNLAENIVTYLISSKDNMEQLNQLLNGDHRTKVIKIITELIKVRLAVRASCRKRHRTRSADCWAHIIFFNLLCQMVL